MKKPIRAIDMRDIGLDGRANGKPYAVLLAKQEKRSKALLKARLDAAKEARRRRIEAGIDITIRDSKKFFSSL